MKNHIILAVDDTVDAPTQTVWTTLINTDAWWGGAALDPKFGGAFREVWVEDGQDKVATGEVTTLVPNKTLAIAWQEPEWPKAMTFTFVLTSLSEDKTKVTLTEEGWEIFAIDEREQLMDEHRQGWSSHLQSLKHAAQSL